MEDGASAILYLQMYAVQGGENTAIIQTYIRKMEQMTDDETLSTEPPLSLPLCGERQHLLALEREAISL